MTERLGVGLALALAVAGCGGAGTQAPRSRAASPEPVAEADRPPHAPLEPSAACPTMLPGVEVTVEEIDSGAAMTFTTSEPAQVDELRARVRVMAGMHQQHAATPAGRTGTMPPAIASVSDVPGGARLELRAIDATDQGALHEQALAQADEMRTAGTCPTMVAPVAS